MAYLDPASNSGLKKQRLEIAKDPLQISFNYSKPFLAYLVNSWQKRYLNDNLFSSATVETLIFSKRNH
jgi:hypothetical protein